MPFTVNGELVDDSVVRAEMRALRPRYEEVARGMDPVQAEAQLRDWSRENVIERVLLRQEALRDSEPAAGEDEVASRIESLVTKVTAKVAQPKHKDVTEYYRKNRNRLHRPEQVRAAHIFKTVDETTDEAAALAAMQQSQREIREGGSFEERASDLGYVPRGYLPREFEELLFSLGENEISDIFRSRAGFHIAKAYNRRPEGISSFAEVEQAITDALYQRKRERALEQFLDRLKASAVIVELSRSA